MSRNWVIKIVLFVVFAAVTVQSGIQLHEHRHHELPIIAGPGVTKVEKLSQYNPGLKGTMADTDIFFLEGKEPGGKMLIMANTHSNEPAALLTAIIFLENAVVERGTLIIIPQFNHSASRNTRPGDGYPLYFHILPIIHYFE